MSRAGKCSFVIVATLAMAACGSDSEPGGAGGSGPDGSTRDQSVSDRGVIMNPTDGGGADVGAGDGDSPPSDLDSGNFDGALPGSNDAPSEKSTSVDGTASGVDADAGNARDVALDLVDAPADVAVPDRSASDSGTRTDAGTSDAGTNTRDAGASDVQPDDASPEAAPDGGTLEAAADAGTDGCTPPSGPFFSCLGVNNCNGATSYCLGGAVLNSCKPIPVECSCAETHTCECLLAHLVSPCAGGTLTCTPYQDGGQLSVFVSNCQ